MTTNEEVPAGDLVESSTEISPKEHQFCTVGSRDLKDARETTHLSQYGPTTTWVVIVLNAFILLALLGSELVQLTCSNETNVGNLAQDIRKLQNAHMDMKFCLFLFWLQFSVFIAFFAKHAFTVHEKVE